MKYVITILFVIVCLITNAQQSYFYANWNVNKPLTNTSWIGNTSQAGGKVGYRRFIGDRKFAVGVDINWATYDEYKPTETIFNPTGAVTTDYFNYVYHYGAVISSQYYHQLGDRERFYTFAGLGLGVSRNEYSVFYNIYQDVERSWGFLARPEAGILVLVGDRRRIGFMAAVHYDFATNKSDSHSYGRFTNTGFQLGILLMDW